MKQHPLDGGPAFPVQESIMSGGDPVPAAQGMSLRDWFAGQALAGMLADSSRTHGQALYVQHAYEFADLMLRERNASGPILPEEWRAKK